ncbi:hypothetical protein KAJ41_00305 [Candidatus Parcubacteria bacterium]|nr:hypothetical protein [Candidatus Parcubacteria bacterium]
MKIILDFDDTIFNTFGMLEELAGVFEKVGFSKEEFFQTYQKTTDRVGDFDLETAINIFEENKAFDREKVKKELNLIIEKADNFVYCDFFNFIRNFKKEELLLLSFGTTDFQKYKIEKSGIVPYFNEVIITSRSKADDIENISKKHNGNIVFIEDKARIIDEVKEKNPDVVTMKIIRRQGRHVEENSRLTNYIIQDLFRLEDVINNLRD